MCSATSYSPTDNGSTIGAGGLNFRVRNGIGCTPSAMIAEHIPRLSPEMSILAPPHTGTHVKARGRRGGVHPQSCTVLERRE
jgi:hypothetical protein